MLRTPGRGAPRCWRSVLGAYGIPYALQRRGAARAHRARPRPARARAPRAAAGRARAEDLLAYLRTPGRLERLELADRLELTVRREGRRTAAQEAPGGWTLGELDRLRGARGRSTAAAALAREARALFAAPYRGRAVQLDADEEVDAHALVALLAALDELADLGDRASTAPSCSSARATGGAGRLAAARRRGARRRPARDPCAALRHGRAVQPAGGRVPAPGDARAVPHRRARRELDVATGLRLAAREDRLARRALPLLRGRLARRAPARAQLPRRRRGGQPGAALVLRRGRACAARRAEPERHRPLSAVTWPEEEAPTPGEPARAEALAASAGERTQPPLGLAHRRRRRPRCASARCCRRARWRRTRAVRCAGSSSSELRPTASSPTPRRSPAACTLRSRRRSGGWARASPRPTSAQAYRPLEEVLAELPQEVALGAYGACGRRARGSQAIPGTVDQELICDENVSASQGPHRRNQASKPPTRSQRKLPPGE